MNLLACLLLASSLPAAEVKKVAVELGKPFRLEKAETAYLPGKRASLRIEKFIDSPCPTGAYCAWSGQAVIPELTVDGKVMRSGAKDAPYDVEVKESDYKTYAVFVVDEPEKACARLEPPQTGECLRGLARRRGSPRLCRAIKEERTRGFCLEDLAGELQDASLCAGVAAPSQYCLYARAKAKGDRALCAGIVLFDWRERCLKELAP